MREAHARMMRSVIAAQDDATPEAAGFFEGPVDVLNYALTLEHLEAPFYIDGLAQFTEQDFLDIGLETSVRDYLDEVAANEVAHVETLSQVIRDLGGEPVEEADYDFGYTSLEEFLSLAQEFENLGVDAYTGAASALIEEDELLTAALTIHAVEARHAAYLNILNGVVPFPDAFDAPLPPPEVLEAVAPFILGDISTPAA